MLAVLANGHLATWGRIRAKQETAIGKSDYKIGKNDELPVDNVPVFGSIH